MIGERREIAKIAPAPASRARKTRMSPTGPCPATQAASAPTAAAAGRVSSQP